MAPTLVNAGPSVRASVSGIRPPLTTVPVSSASTSSSRARVPTRAPYLGTSQPRNHGEQDKGTQFGVDDNARYPDSVAESTSVLEHGARGKDHNSVTIKNNTNVKDAAGAIVKVLNRIHQMFVTALRMDASNDSLNRAVKAIAVARKYIKDEQPTAELSFLPLHRTNPEGVLDPNLFAFLVFKTAVTVELKEFDDTDLCVSRGSDANSMANAIIRVVMERGQAVMKAGGSDAMFVAMTAVINARRRLKRKHNMDIMLVPTWITEDTSATLGRESKFLKFNILPCPINGPLDQTVHPSLSTLYASNMDTKASKVEQELQAVVELARTASLTGDIAEAEAIMQAANLGHQDIQQLEAQVASLQQ